MINNHRTRGRQSIRLDQYDYSCPGEYFVTLCIQDRECILGRIEEGMMILNDAGKMVSQYWCELKNKYQGISLDEHIVMPNHFHGIIFIHEDDQTVGADLCVRPHTGQTRRSAPTVGQMIQWFKTMTTNAYIRNVWANHWRPFRERLWQRNYYEHIIRDEQSLKQVREYVVNNPQNWERDEYKTIIL